jgi:hypothetical protein
MAIDVFGLTATDSTDMGIGQKWEQFVDQADVVLPMTYPSHYAPGTYGLGNPNAHPYAVLDHSLRDARRRSAGISGAGQLVPWYQDFTLGPPRYGAEHVRAQMPGRLRQWRAWLDAVESWKPVHDGSAASRDPQRGAGAQARSTTGTTGSRGQRAFDDARRLDALIRRGITARAARRSVRHRTRRVLGREVPNSRYDLERGAGIAPASRRPSSSDRKGSLAPQITAVGRRSPKAAAT